MRDLSGSIADPLILSKARVTVILRFAQKGLNHVVAERRSGTQLSGVRNDGGDRSDDAATCGNAKNTGPTSATTDTTSTPGSQAGDCPAGRAGGECLGSTETLPCPNASHDGVSAAQTRPSRRRARVHRAATRPPHEAARGGPHLDAGSLPEPSFDLQFHHREKKSRAANLI